MYVLTNQQIKKVNRYLESIEGLTFAQGKQIKEGIRDYLLVREFYDEACMFPSVHMNEWQQRDFLKKYAELCHFDYYEPEGCLDIDYGAIRYTLVADPQSDEPRVSYFFDVYMDDEEPWENLDIRAILGIGFDKPER